MADISKIERKGILYNIKDTTARNLLQQKYTVPIGGIPKEDLSLEVQNLLQAAKTAIQNYTETDPTVPAWAKSITKPTYTAQEVGALPSTTHIPVDPVNADWNASSGLAQILNKPALFSGDYNDLINKPVIPTNVSSFVNDAGYLTQHQDISGKANISDLATVAMSGSYNDLIDKPVISSSQRTLINIDDSDGLVFTDSNGDELTHAQVKALLDDEATDVIFYKDCYFYILQYIEDGDYLFQCFECDGFAVHVLEFFWDDNAFSYSTADYDYSVDSSLNASSSRPVQNRIITAALNGKQNTLTFDNLPTANSNNPVKSSGLYTLFNKVAFVDSYSDASEMEQVIDDGELKSGDLGFNRDDEHLYYVNTPNWEFVRILDKYDLDNLATVATSGSYDDLSDTPDVPIAISVNEQSFVMNQFHAFVIPDYYTKTQIDNAGYVTSSDVSDAVADLVDSAPSTLDTLNELAAALGDDPNFATTIATALGNKVDKEVGKGLFSGSYNDLTNKPNIPSAYDDTALSNRVTALENAGFLTSETDPNVPAWAKQSTKPTYNASEVGALPSDTHIPVDPVQSNWSETDNTSLAYIQNKPSLFSGSYTDLTNKPSLFSGSWNDLTDKPSLFSGSYTDLTDKPTLFSGDYADLTNKPSLFSGNYNDLTNKPTIPTVPTNVSSFINDSGYLTAHQSIKTVNGQTMTGTGDIAIKVYMGTCPTSATVGGSSVTQASRSTKVCTVETFPTDSNGKPLIGTVIGVKYAASNTFKTDTENGIAQADHKINVNNTGDITLYYNNAKLSSSTSANTLVAGYKNRYAYYVYDGTYWVWLTASYDSNTTYSGMTQAEVDAGTGTTARLITPQRLRDNFYTEGEVDTLLSAKANSSSLATVATSGSYNDLSSKPTIPTKVSDLQNDSGFTTNAGTVTGVKMNNGSAILPVNGVVDLGTVLTSHQDISGKADVVTIVTNSSTGSVSQALDPNKFYKFTGALTALTLTLNAGTGLCIYAGKFTSDSGTACTVTIPNDIKLADNAPSVEAGSTYEFSIADNLMLLVKEGS